MGLLCGSILIFYIVCIIVNTVIQFCTRYRRMVTFDYPYIPGFSGSWAMFIVFGIIMAPFMLPLIIIIESDTKLSEFSLRKDIDFILPLYFLPVIALLGLYWI